VSAADRIGIGIVGCGRIADLQCLGYLDHPGAAIVAVCDADAGRAAERARAWGAPGVHDRLEVHGTEGIVWVNRCTGQLLDEPPVVLYREGETRAFHDLEADWAESLRRGGLDFVDALLEGGAPEQDLAVARETLVLALAADRSAREGREVALDELRGPADGEASRGAAAPSG